MQSLLNSKHQRKYGKCLCETQLRPWITLIKWYKSMVVTSQMMWCTEATTWAASVVVLQAAVLKESISALCHRFICRRVVYTLTALNYTDVRNTGSQYTPRRLPQFMYSSLRWRCQLQAERVGRTFALGPIRASVTLRCDIWGTIKAMQER